jgi:peptidoglycan-associated lipoprotein
VVGAAAAGEAAVGEAAAAGERCTYGIFVAEPSSMKTIKVLSVIMFAGLAALESGCAHQDAIPPVVSAPYQEPPVATTTITSAQANLASQLAVSDELTKACQLHFGDVDQAPKFSFDNSDVGTQDRAVLDQIATCVTSGPLQGRGLALVGRADPRGESEYNMALGQRRASSVSQYLAQLGVDSGKIDESSRGNLDAMGTTDETWQRDRRVDISLR